MFLEAKGMDELKRAYESMEGERIVRFCQAMVLAEAKKAGGIEEIVKYDPDEALVDIIKANSKGIPKHVIRQHVKTGNWRMRTDEQKK